MQLHHESLKMSGGDGALPTSSADTAAMVRTEVGSTIRGFRAGSKTQAWLPASGLGLPVFRITRRTIFDLGFMYVGFQVLQTLNPKPLNPKPLTPKP